MIETEAAAVEPPEVRHRQYRRLKPEDFRRALTTTPSNRVLKRRHAAVVRQAHRAWRPETFAPTKSMPAARLRTMPPPTVTPPTCEFVFDRRPAFIAQVSARGLCRLPGIRRGG